jgi:hypothetical protein
MSSNRLFQICTLVTNWSQYHAMKSSYVAVGFAEANCRFSVFDNTAGNVFEPYSLINRLLAEAEATYIILCHQDILLNKGCGYSDLVKIIEELEIADPHWAVLGNAGCTDDFKWIVHVDDPTKWEASDAIETRKPLAPPCLVHSLDENFLVVKRGADVRASAALNGFHLYGTDLCLHARRNGHSCYVIHFPLTHLSAGSFGEEFFSARQRFIERWNPEFSFLYVVRGLKSFSADGSSFAFWDQGKDSDRSF